MTVASDIIRKFGGAQAVAEACGVSFTAVYRWTYPRDRGGTGGVIPAKHQQALLRAAVTRGIKLKPADFFEPVSRRAS